MTAENWTVPEEEDSDDSQSTSSSNQHNPSLLALFSYFFSSRLLVSAISIRISVLAFTALIKPVKVL